MSWSQQTRRMIPGTTRQDGPYDAFDLHNKEFVFKLKMPVRKYLFTDLSTLKIPITTSRTHAKKQLALHMASET